MKPEARPGVWPLALSTGILINKPLTGVLELIKESGFSSIEIAASLSHFDYHDDNAISQVRRKLEELKIKVNSFHAPYKDYVDLTLLEDKERNKAVGEVLATAKALFALGGRFLVLHAGSEEQSIPGEEVNARLEQARKSLLEIYQHCQKLGITMAVEDMLAHLLGGKLEQVQWLVSHLPDKQAGICLDTGHSFLTGKLIERVHSFGSRIIMAHIHDNNCVYDDHLPPGDGKLPWFSLFSSFMEVRFHGPLVLELIGHGDSGTSLADARRGAEFLRQLTYYQTTSA